MEATVEWRHLNLHSGFLDRLPFPHSYEDQQPGNEGPFYCNRGICPDEVEPTPENAPHVANAMLEALAHHNHRQSKARDHQEYQQQQNNTESLMADFPSSTPVDQDEPTDLEGLEGATIAHPRPARPPWRHLRLALPHWHQPRKRYPSRNTIAARPQSSSGHPPTSTGMRTERTWTMRISSHKMTQPTSKSATGHRCQYCRSQISHHCKMPQPRHPK